MMALLLALAACSAQSTPGARVADTALPVPESAPVHEHAPVPLEGRDPDAVRLVDDLVIGADAGTTGALLYAPRHVAAAPDGTIFVADSATDDIKRFAADGTLLTILGGEGQGPGEFLSIGQLTIAGDRLVAWDTRNRRFSVWTLEGEHVADHAAGQLESPDGVEGLDDGTLVWRITEIHQDGSRERVIARLSTDGEELDRLVALPSAMPTLTPERDPATMLQDIVDGMDAPRLSFQVGGGSTVYVTTEQDYEVLAMSPEGEVRWALRVDWPRWPWPDERKQRVIDAFARDYPDAAGTRPADLDWPEHSAALIGLSSDGAGRLYTFINPGEVDPDAPRRWPVDVYSPEGEYLASGTVPYRWSYARGDYVYGTRTSDDDETVVVRYRLLVNGQ
jgi:hypothetical protein